MTYNQKSYQVIVFLILGLLSDLKAQLFKPCMVYEDKFTGVVSKTFFANLAGGSIVIGGVAVRQDTVFSITLTGHIAEMHFDRFGSEEGDSCIVIHKSGERTRLMAKGKSQFSVSSLGHVMGVTYYIDTATLQDFIKDPPTDIGIFGRPYHIPIPIAKFEQKLIPKAIECFFRL